MKKMGHVGNANSLALALTFSIAEEREESRQDMGRISSGFCSSQTPSARTHFGAAKEGTPYRVSMPFALVCCMIEQGTVH